MRVAVTGASGLIGSVLVPALGEAGHDVLRLVRRVARAPDEVEWNPVEGTIDAFAVEGVGAVVHLAGVNIGQHWTSRVRREIRDSRVLGTRLVAEAVAGLDPRPALICASAVGYYGGQGDDLLTERSPRGSGFLAELVEDWEQAADPAREAGARVVHLRQSPVLARDGGMLERMLLPFRLGLGGPIGGGRQWWSWVALDDVVSAYLFALEQPLEGRYNLVPRAGEERRVRARARRRSQPPRRRPAARLCRSARLGRDGRGDAARQPARRSAGSPGRWVPVRASRASTGARARSRRLRVACSA